MAEEYYRLPGKVLAVALLLAFAMWLPLLVVPTIEDVISRQLAISHALTALVYSSPVAVLALVAIPGGFLADRIGLKKAIGAGAIILAIGAGLRGISSDFSSLIGFTLIYGFGLGICFPNLPKLARHCSPRERSNITLGIFTVAILLSGALSLSLAKPVIYAMAHSFQGVFFISSLPAVVAAVFWWVFIDNPPCESAAAEAVGFDLAALRKMATRSDLWLASTLFLLHNIVLYTWLGWMPAFLASIGAGASTAGLITSLMLWAGIPSVIFLSRLSTKLGRRKPFLWGSSLLIVVASCSVLWITLPLSWLLMLFTGSATSIRFAMILALPVEMVTPEQSGSASGMVMSVGYVGALIGPLIGGLILDKTGSYPWIFLSLAIVSAVTAFVAFVVPETGR